MPNHLISRNKNWYVLTTKPKAEKKISKRLTENDIDNYLPLHSQLRSWHDRKKWVEMPLFSSYLFVYIEDKYRSKVFQVDGILRYVSIAGKVSILSEEEIERIKRICTYLGEVEVEKENFKLDEEVEIISGHFAGFCGQVTSFNDKCKFRISIPGLGSFVTVTIEKEHIKKR
ncbi:MAG: UpxY family transcription antiterminator [Paludibacteraceae bacterium]